MVAVFFLIPLALMVWMSLHDWPLLGQVRFAGGGNYKELVQDSTFAHSLLFTAKYTALVTPMQVLLGYVLALVVRRRMPAVGLFRTLYFMPVVVGFAAAAYMFVVMLQPETGIYDGILKALGLGDGQTAWLADPNLALLVISLMVTWKSVGVTMILFMAGMQAVPEDIYEAARVDGAGWWSRELRITLPLLRRTIALVLVLTIAGSFLAFDQFYILTQGGPQNATLTTVMWIYTVSFIRYRLGYGATLSIALLVLLVALSVTQIILLRERTER